MDKTIVLLLLCWIGYNAALDVDVKIFGETSLTIMEGGSLKLICHLSKGMEMILHYNVHWIHVPSSGAETILTEQQRLSPGTDDKHFAVGMNFLGDNTNVTLDVTNALPSFHGRFICRAAPMAEGDAPQAEVSVMIPSDVQNLVLSFDGEQVNSASEVPVQREEGTFPITCQASGSNPEATVQLFLDGEPLSPGEPETTPDTDATQSTGAPRFQTSVSIGKKTLTGQNNGQVLSCKAKANFDGALEKMASMPLTIIALEPETVCEKNASGRPGDKYVRLRCRVQHQRVDVDHYSFEIGYTGEIVNAINESANHNRVIVEAVEGKPHTDDVTLILYETKDEHFSTYYYLDVFLKNGQRFRETAKLLLRDASGATAPAACTFTFLLLPLLSLFVWRL